MLFDESKGYTDAVVGDSAELLVGEEAIAVGNPLLPEINETKLASATTPAEYVGGIKSAYIDALCLTATDGVISNVSEPTSFGSLLNDSTVKMRLIRVSSAINSGNSGGGLFDIDGRLIGIVNGKLVSEGYDNVGYVIPINIASSLADKIIAECTATESRVKVVTDKSLGLTLYESKSGENSPSFDKETQKWNTNNAVVVKTVSSLGPLGSAGLKIEDIINSVKIGESVYEINHIYDFNDYMIKVRLPDNTVNVVFNVTRVEGGNTVSKDITVTLSSTNFTTVI